MGNMGYCRMENTAQDLKDCFLNWEETASRSELEARSRILALCKKIVNYYGDDECDDSTDSD
jgi:hypothetical protein